MSVSYETKAHRPTPLLRSGSLRRFVGSSLGRGFVSIRSASRVISSPQQDYPGEVSSISSTICMSPYFSNAFTALWSYGLNSSKNIPGYGTGMLEKVLILIMGNNRLADNYWMNRVLKIKTVLSPDNRSFIS
jgi:hypothetical protein